MRTLSLLLLALLLALLSVGCASGEKRTYTFEVKNASAKPITVGLATNDGLPPSVDFESPADRAIMDPKNTGIGWGIVIPPGKSAGVTNLTAEFNPNTIAVLRVYLGDLPLNDILAIGPGSRNRIDLRLREGTTRFLVTDRGPFVDVNVASYQPAGEEAKRSPALRQTTP